MAKYKNLIILILMLVMAVFIGAAVTGIGNMIIGNDNREIAADTCGVTVQIMEASEEQFLLNMVNSAQYEVDCLSGDFVLQRQNEEGEWQTIDTIGTEQPLDRDSEAEGASPYDLPSGENRAFWFRPVGEDGASVLTEGEYRICKDIYREMEKENEYQNLTLTTEFSYPQILSEKRGYHKPVEEAEVAAKLARTVLPEQKGMADYWNPEVTEVMASLTEEEEKAGAEAAYWKVIFPAEAADADAWSVYVARSDGSTYGPYTESR